MELIIKGTPQKIAALVLAVQERQGEREECLTLDGKVLAFVRSIQIKRLDYQINGSVAELDIL